MTTKEIATFFNVTSRTIQLKAKQLGIELKQKVKKDWTKEECDLIAKSFNNEKTNFVNSLQKIDRIESMFIQFIERQNETNQILLKLISNQPKQIENKVNKISVKDYIKKNNITSFNFNSLCVQVGKQAARLSKELHREIAFTNDGQFDVGLYDEDLMQTAVLIAKRLIEKENNLFKEI